MEIFEVGFDNRIKKGVVAMSDFNFTKKSLDLPSGKTIDYYSLSALEEAGHGNLSSIPKSVKILLESFGSKSSDVNPS